MGINQLIFLGCDENLKFIVYCIHQSSTYKFLALYDVEANQGCTLDDLGSASINPYGHIYVNSNATKNFSETCQINIWELL